MTQRQIIHSVDADDFAWLKTLADADNVGVGEIVRRCIHFARQQSAPDDEPQGPTEEELEAQRWEAERQAAIAQKRAELEALMNGEPGASGPIRTQDLPGAASVLDLDLSAEPRAEDVEIPPDPDDAPTRIAPRPASRIPSAPVSRADAYAPARGHVAIPSLLDTTALTPPSGMRPGTATRPAPPNRELAMGLRMGDPGGNVVRANFSHLGFSRGGV